MKKKYYIVFALVLFICLVVIYNKNSRIYPFEQDVENIEKVELLKNDDATKYKDFTFTVLYTLKDDEIDGFIEKFKKLEHPVMFGYPADNYGILVIKVYYSNGDIEMKGSNNTEYITDSGTNLKWYNYDDEDFYNIFVEYVDEEKLPII